MGRKDPQLGLVQLTDRAHGYMQKGEGLGWSNAGLIAGPERLIFNVARAYREFRGEPHDQPVDSFETAEVMAEIKRSHCAREMQ